MARCGSHVLLSLNNTFISEDDTSLESVQLNQLSTVLRDKQQITNSTRADELMLNSQEMDQLRVLESRSDNQPLLQLSPSQSEIVPKDYACCSASRQQRKWPAQLMQQPQEQKQQEGQQEKQQLECQQQLWHQHKEKRPQQKQLQLLEPSPSPHHEQIVSSALSTEPPFPEQQDRNQQQQEDLQQVEDLQFIEEKMATMQSRSAAINRYINSALGLAAFSCVYCCFLFGLVACILAIMAQRRYRQGNLDEAHKLMKASVKFSWAAIIVGIVIAVIVFLMFIDGSLSGHAGGGH